MHKLRTLLTIQIPALTARLQGRAFVVGAAAGAAVGYTLEQKGYEVRARRSPSRATDQAAEGA